MLRPLCLVAGILFFSAAAFAAPGHSLPDRNFTPGVAADDVTSGNIDSTICVSGFTKPPRRPPVAYTNGLKSDQLSDPARGYDDQDMGDYEEDHLIPLELGGAPKDPRNLWPEPYEASGFGARVKDKLERKLNRLVCAHQIDLSTAQQAIATDWIKAYGIYMDMPIENDDADNDDR